MCYQPSIYYIYYTSVSQPEVCEKVRGICEKKSIMAEEINKYKKYKFEKIGFS